ncbi:MAG TPA: ATP-binding protein [Terriglobia bacterium]|nr:ATP-binding protein [Terriglobia bacterium]
MATLANPVTASRPSLRFRTLLATVLSLGLVVCGFFSIRQQISYRLPSDGVAWVDSASGVQAWLVTPGGAGDLAGIRPGDVLKAVNDVPVASAAAATRQVFESGIGAQLTYGLDRNGQPTRTIVTVERESHSGPPRGYLDAVGLIYLFVGGFILFRRWSAAKSLHFYFFCLTSFVLFVFHYTGKLNSFDQTVYWLNVAATLFQPAIFLHFCLTFPKPVALLRQKRWLAPLLYVPGLVLGAFHVLAMWGAWGDVRSAVWLADRVESIYLAGLFILGGAVLEHSYRTSRMPLRKQQLKWVTRGTYVAVAPYALLYAVPYFLGIVPPPWMQFSALSLIFLPITFGYALVRYRLMDVDIIFRRGMAYTLATAVIVGMYFALIGLFADFFRSQVRDLGRGGWILALMVTAVLFQPFVNWIQARLDRFFNPERYDYRRTLLEFARELTAELRVDRLLDQVTQRLAETLGVERVAVILGPADTPPDGTDCARGMRLAAARGLSAPLAADWSFLDPGRAELAKGYLFYENVRRVQEVSPAAAATIEELDLHYYLPFKIKDRTLGYLGLGKTRHGDYLSSEDVDLLKTIASYVSIALENARLYGSLERQADEQRALHDFSESIIESISAGVLSIDLAGRVGSWNSALEKLYGWPRSKAVGKMLGDILPPELLVELPTRPDAAESRSLYKFRLATPGGREVVANISTTPLVDQGGKVIGRLLIFNDLTERVSLEDQLVQAEKLSSIGLLAAGVAHEVNTPLAVIASQGQMLLRQLPAEDAQARTLERIIKQAFRASDIVNSLLKFSRVSGSEFAELDINKVMQETLALVEPMLKASKVSLNLQLAEDLPCVRGNAGKLQQVFMNLLVNARDAMPRGGELTVATERENGSVRVEVCDTGMGIAPDHLGKIFDPFFTTKAKSRGTGLGLAVSYGIIREHSGNVEVESRLGHGSTFRLEFPALRKTVHAV